MKIDKAARRQLTQIVVSLALVAGIGFVAIGASGALAAGMGAVFGRSFVAGDTNGVTYTKARCADFMEYYPKSRTCEAAATSHHFDETVMYRTAAGVLGVLIIGAVFVFKRRLRSEEPLAPVAFTPTVGASVFGVAAAGMLFLSVMSIAAGQTTGAGGFLSAGIVSALVALGFSVSFARTVLRTGS